MIQSIHKFDMGESQIKWTIFLILLCLFPAAFFIIFDIGIWPVLDVFFRMIPSTFFRVEYKWSLLLFVQCSIWVGLLYFLSWQVSRKLGVVRYKRKFIYLSLVLFAIFLLAMLPIFGLYYESQKTDSASSAFYYYFTDKKLF